VSQQPDKNRAFWVRGPRTSRHIYFYPTNDLPGIALFVLIAALGAIALGIGVLHLIGAHAIIRRDVILAVVGAAATPLGLVQAVRLWRQSRP
jgi:hypothetical protein